MVKSISNWKWNILFRQKKKNDADCRKEDKKDIVKNKVILKTQQRFKSERHNIFTEVINKMVLSSIGDKRMQSVDAIEKYAYGTSKDLIRKKEKIIEEYNPNKKQKILILFDYMVADMLGNKRLNPIVTE